MSTKVVQERKEMFNLYLQSILKIKELCSAKSISNFILYFLKVLGGPDIENGKYKINIWKMGQELSFDCHHILQLRLSARNIPIEQDDFNGCCLKISQKECHSNFYPSMRHYDRFSLIINILVFVKPYYIIIIQQKIMY